MEEKLYIGVVVVAGILFGITVLFSHVIGAYLYSKTLEGFLLRGGARGKRLGAFGQGLLGLLNLVAPILILTAIVIGVVSLGRWVLVLPDSLYYRRALGGGMMAGFIGAAAARRYMTKRKH